MNIGMIGLGKMGANMARRLMEGGHSCYVYDRDAEKVRELLREGALASSSLAELVGVLPKPCVIWMMVPAGSITETTVLQLKVLLSPGDIVVDGGNSYFKDSVKHASLLAENGIPFVDVGTSGGVWGAERGYCLMIGGDPEVVGQLEPLFTSLCPGPRIVDPTARRRKQSTAEEGYLHCGPIGAGHFVKMVHNGIEYGMMQAFAEGFDILKNADSKNVPENCRYQLDLPEIAEVWRRGSVVSSWLLDLLAGAMSDDPLLTQYVGDVQDSGEGRWTVQSAMEESVPADVITAALFARFRSRRDHTFGEKVLSAMRHEFGGHVEPVRSLRETRQNVG